MEGIHFQRRKTSSDWPGVAENSGNRRTRHAGTWFSDREARAAGNPCGITIELRAETESAHATGSESIMEVLPVVRIEGEGKKFASPFLRRDNSVESVLDPLAGIG